MGAADGLERTLIAIAAQCLRIAPQEIDPCVPLTRYGLDSLTALELAEAVAAKTALELSEEAFYEAPSIQSLALRLLTAIPTEHTSEEVEHRIARMYADAKLEPHIDPAGLRAGRAGCILLTGANGFVGAHLLRALLAEGAGEVVCLIRAPDDAMAAQRLASANASYGLPTVDARANVVAGDIGAPAFGLGPVAYRGLAERVGVVLHCAAEVNWAATYAQLRPVNVEATRALLRFACTHVAKSFQFVSSVAAGYSTLDASPLHETALPADPAGLHLGYAQSKWVAEQLVEAARRRGLPAATYRPTLVAGHSESGIGNDDDLFSRMLRGCVGLGHAPDLDWVLDACPVDFVAEAIARAAVREPAHSRVVHLCNPRPARWREAVLWMNLRGYEVKLEPYARWVERVRQFAGSDHPLQALRSFLLHKPPRESGLHLPELYARPRVRELLAVDSDAMLSALDLECPRLGAQLLERYFDRWVQTRRIAAVRSPASVCRPPRRTELRDVLEGVIQRHFRDSALRVLDLSTAAFGIDHSLLGETAAWRAGMAYAMQRCCVSVRRGNGATARLDLVLKRKLPDAVVLDVAHEVATLCDPALGHAFGRHRARSEFSGSASRELVAYAEATPTMRAVMPLCFGVLEDEVPVIVLEHVVRTALANAVEDPARWTAPCLEAVLKGIAAVHAQASSETLPVVAAVRASRTEAIDEDARSWFAALGRHASQWLTPWLGPAWAVTHERALEHLPAVERWMAGQPLALIHGDFNPRNFVLRDTPLGPRLCAFDWELAAWDLPQRDIVECLAFALPPDVEPAVSRHWLEVHRRAYERHLGGEIDSRSWYAGVRAALADFGTRRLPLYFLAHRFRPQAFLERVARCWWQLARALGTQP